MGKFFKDWIATLSKMTARRKGVLFFFLILFPHLVFCAVKPDLSRYAAYLNSVKTLEAVFFERNSKGGAASGKLYVHRPSAGSPETFGRMRLAYDPPREIDIFVDGQSLFQYDRKEDDFNAVPLESTPIAFLLRETVSFANEVTVRHIHQDAQITRITVYQTEEPDAGMLTLVFAENPLELKQWIITDAQNVKTIVTLDQVKTNMSFPASVFRLKKSR